MKLKTPTRNPFWAVLLVGAAVLAARDALLEGAEFETEEHGIVSGDLGPGRTTYAEGLPLAARGGRLAADADAWSTYGHDGRRTFASEAGCVPGPLKTSWRHVPTVSGNDVKETYHAIARHDAAFLYFMGIQSGFARASAMARLSPAGETAWSKLYGRDATFGHWPSLVPSMGAVLVNDDGHVLWDEEKGGLATKKGAEQAECDWWGQTIIDAERMYILNEHADDCPPMGLFAFEHGFTRQIWGKLQHGGGPANKGAATDLTQGIALDGGAIFYAPRYEWNDKKNAIENGLYAFDAAAGSQRFHVEATPTSAISAGDGRVYLVEGPDPFAGGDKLQARSGSDGAVLWSQPAVGAGRQAPVQAAGLVIAATAAGVSAFDAVTGAPRWTTPVAGAVSPPMFIIASGAFGKYKVWAQKNMNRYIPTTTMAAALASGTLVVTGKEAIHVLGLADGREIWKGTAAMADGRAREPVIVGSRVYVTDSPADMSKAGLLALDAEVASGDECKDAGGPADAGGGGAGGGSAGTGGDGGGGGGGGAPDQMGGDGGCGCRLGAAGSPAAAPIVLALLAAAPLATRPARRRRR